MFAVLLNGMPATDGSYTLDGGQWLDNSSDVCKQCPSDNPSVMECNNNKVVTQPGYYSLYAGESRRSIDGYLPMYTNALKVYPT